MAERLSQEEIAECLGDSFTLHLDSGDSAETKLVEVKDLGRREIEGLRPDPFSLLFHVPKHVEMWQGTYKFEHHRLGVLDIFVVPVGMDENVWHYEAVYN